MQVRYMHTYRQGGMRGERCIPVLIVHRKGQQRLDQVVRKQVRGQTELLELVTLHIVVVRFGLRARIRDVDFAHVQTQLVALGHENVGNLVDTPRLRDLVEHPRLSFLSRVIDGDLEALDGVPDVEHSPGLSTLSVHGERVAEGGLDAEPVRERPVDAVVVKAVDQHRISHRLLGANTVDDALVEVRGRNVPRPRREQNVRAVVDLGQVIERSTLLRIWKLVLASVVLNLDVPLLDVNVRGPVLSHCPELDQVAVRRQLLDGVQHVQRADNVILLRVDGPRPINHGVRRRALLSKVDDGLRLEGGERLLQEAPVAHVADHELDVLSGNLGPLLDAVVRRGDRGQRVGSKLQIDGPPHQVVHDGDLVSAGGQVKGGCPATVPIPSDDHHTLSSTRGMGRAGQCGLGCDGPDPQRGRRGLPRGHDGGPLEL